MNKLNNFKIKEKQRLKFFNCIDFQSAPSFSHGLASSHGSLGLGAHSSGGSVSLGSSYSVAPSASFSSFNSIPSGSAFHAPG